MSLVLAQKSGRPATEALQHVPVGSAHRIWSAVFAGGRAFCADRITASRGLNAQHNRTACRHSAAVPIAAKGEASMHILLVKPSGPDCGSQDVDGPSGLGLKEDSAGGFEATSAYLRPAGVGNAGRCVHRAGFHSPLRSHFRPRLCHGPPGQELKHLKPTTLCLKPPISACGISGGHAPGDLGGWQPLLLCHRQHLDQRRRGPRRVQGALCHLYEPLGSPFFVQRSHAFNSVLSDPHPTACLLEVITPSLATTTTCPKAFQKAASAAWAPGCLKDPRSRTTATSGIRR